SAQSINLTVSGAPAGVTATVTPGSVTAGNSATLNISTTSSVTPGSYPITVTGSAASGSHTSTFTLTVTGTQPGNDFSVAVNPNSGSVAAGSSVSATISTAVTAGSAQNLNLAVVSQPVPGITATITPGSVTAGNSATLNISTSSAVTPGTYPLGISATGASGNHIASYTLTVTGTTPTTGLVNGDLESGSLAPWTCQSGGAVVSTPVHSGTKALQAAATAAQTGECAQTVTLKPNTSYTLSGWVQGNYAYIGVNGGATASAWANSSGWTKVSVPFTTGANGTVSVYLHGWYGQGNVYGDDFSIA
ncbi:carbohydrate binding domain-containing protein, partial [Kitasatospora sp. NPDC058184]|uniref:carbohydrate binding domain-containing protein n=1 Tax=Kitasatospora sp. NPDC058184 TaxID=3346370 RepID=UPI0036DE48AD